MFFCANSAFVFGNEFQLNLKSAYIPKCIHKSIFILAFFLTKKNKKSPSVLHYVRVFTTFFTLKNRQFASYNAMRFILNTFFLNCNLIYFFWYYIQIGSFWLTNMVNHGINYVQTEIPHFRSIRCHVLSHSWYDHIGHNWEVVS